MSNEGQKGNQQIEKVARIQYGYDLVNHWIDNTDNKVNASCAIFTVVFGVVTFLSGRILVPEESIQGCLYCYYKLVLILSIVTMCIGFFLHALAIVPNLKSGGQGMVKKYPIFYGDIAKIKDEDYKVMITGGSEEDYTDEIIVETHFNAGIANAKMKKFKVGAWFSIIAIGLAFVGLIMKALM